MPMAEIYHQSRPQRTSGEGRLSLKKVEDRTRIGTLFQEGSAKLRFPQNPGGHLEAVMINTAGGLTGGDRMRWHFGLGEDCHASLTTQACEKIYKAEEGSTATVETTIDVAEGGSVAWLPQETILFERSALSRQLTVNLAATATALIVESVVFGRKAMGEDIDTATFRDCWRIRRGDKLEHAENFSIGPDAGAMLARPALLGGRRVLATVLLIAEDCERHLDDARAITGKEGGVSAWSGKLLARLIDDDAYSLRKRLIPLIGLLNKKAELPKVWST
ncbi:urease accessory protein UreD [Paramesorhizobium deserti]|uniref:Urease accessory protein UreD n=2 Tax=Paramesorhizobium deserti TaxID=1494590 RepID=A0A135I0K3_9HYPH|nr:urease accessory protein UreD [Paramesorhizobium deserti]KXF78953.1 urease accessory protein UreD [Paramesorhizobium deserti]